MNFTDQDKFNMIAALTLAKGTFLSGNFPVGAVLEIDGNIAASNSNQMNTLDTWIDHAETRIFLEHSKKIKKAKENNSYLKLYTTLEPCAMCLGTSMLHRIDEIIYACPDPYGGAAGFKDQLEKPFFNNNNIILRSGLLKESSYQLLEKFLEKQDSNGWVKINEYFKTMKNQW